ncbi:hypothetical protein R1flu_010467 [Riccia fluitans]|uniref:Uncharacterized protein n=1 Tax=Riccia fluitans TaxID=41844 RepID=A0ABD1Z585_9MARC
MGGCSRARPEESKLPIAEAFSEAKESELPRESVFGSIRRVGRIGAGAGYGAATAPGASTGRSPNSDAWRQYRPCGQCSPVIRKPTDKWRDHRRCTPPPLQQHDPLGAGLAGSESSDDQNSLASLPEGQRFNTVPPVMYASASPEVSTMGTPTFNFGVGTSQPKTTHPGTAGGPTPIPPLFTMPQVRSRSVNRSVKRRAAASPPKAS